MGCRGSEGSNLLADHSTVPGPGARRPGTGAQRGLPHGATPTRPRRPKALIGAADRKFRRILGSRRIRRHRSCFSSWFAREVHARENTMMRCNSVQPCRLGVISELALARGPDATRVLIIDDLFSSRLLLAEIVRQIDGKLNLELFDTPRARSSSRATIVSTSSSPTTASRVRRHRAGEADPQRSHCVDVPMVGRSPSSTTAGSVTTRSKPAPPIS